MPYDRLAQRLEERASPALATLADGSIDQFCTLSAGGVGPLRTRAAMGREILDTNRSTFRMDIETTEPGGQAVNVAQQLHAMGSDVTCYGHLDDAVFDTLPFETVSMGDPAVVYAFNFNDSDVMFADKSTDAADWTFEDLRAVDRLSSGVQSMPSAGATGFPFPALLQPSTSWQPRNCPGFPFRLRPRDIVGFDRDGIEALRQALSAMQDTFDVVYNANRQEIRATAATLPRPPAETHDQLEAIRESMGIDAVVMHAPTEAAVAAGGGTSVVETVHIDRATRHTGGGDTFSCRPRLRPGPRMGLGAGSRLRERQCGPVRRDRNTWESRGATHVSRGQTIGRASTPGW
ncbi:MAG: hypothetical protein U5K37_12895 [Natrialbaceae archaeon]|nr:hypothetical protein [Natrialbaceae archaeon]